MAGHSKWANIKHKKAGIDAKRSKEWTRLIKEIYISMHLGSSDPTKNPRLRLAVDKAADANMPKENVRRVINRYIGNPDDAKNYEEIRYEGYGIGGVAIMLDTLTKNRTRTVAEVRHAFSKFGGNMSSDGSVAFMFERVGQFLFEPGIDEDILIGATLKCGAKDITINDSGFIEVLCDWKIFSKVKDMFENSGIRAKFSKVTMISKNKIELTHDSEAKTLNLLEELENIDDVQELYTNVTIIDSNQK
ncbi:MAG: YebC/PmpR family DNA-binding transcriptional regulator [Burkholderia sp.]|nr:YebC/PmpR family DNA-binding transcriptional regulator [Burkholderia sp.]